MGKYFNKEAGLQHVDWKTMGKDFVGPSLALGGLMGAGVLAFTAKDKKEFKQNLPTAVTTGVAGDALTGVVLGLVKQRKELLKKG